MDEMDELAWLRQVFAKRPTWQLRALLTITVAVHRINPTWKHREVSRHRVLLLRTMLAERKAQHTR